MAKENLDTLIEQERSIGMIGKFFQRHPVVLTLGFLLGATACAERFHPPTKYELPNGYVADVYCLSSDKQRQEGGIEECSSLGFCSPDGQLVEKSLSSDTQVATIEFNLGITRYRCIPGETGYNLKPLPTK
jgi:hypothetical protein